MLTALRTDHLESFGGRGSILIFERMGNHWVFFLEIFLSLHLLHLKLRWLLIQSRPSSLSLDWQLLVQLLWAVFVHHQLVLHCLVVLWIMHPCDLTDRLVQFFLLGLEVPGLLNTLKQQVISIKNEGFLCLLLPLTDF